MAIIAAGLLGNSLDPKPKAGPAIVLLAVGTGIVGIAMGLAIGTSVA